ncbi:MAG TPA: histidine kinase dimerization/phospho-acceptor domain-containing protein, partial [Candidatus Binatus sp.]|nr:histidine kinase dimerization/phospho-acceptor domain-containing protein [Candidatus Binatus sp.]
MDRSPTNSFIVGIVLGLAPAAILLIVLAATGAVSAVWVIIVVALGLALGAIPAMMIGSSISRRAERLDAVATALHDKRLPPHLLPDTSDAIGLAERHLLDAADAIVADVDSLAEQRDEFEAILRSMTEAVVVTGARGEVILLNGAARRIFSLGADTDYRARPFVELCRDPRLQEFVGRSMQSTDKAVMSAEIMIQNPVPLHVSASAAQIRTSRGAAWVFVFHDITKLKSYETLRADFISNLTHELRTPLSALYGYAETLIRGV